MTGDILVYAIVIANLENFTNYFHDGFYLRSLKRSIPAGISLCFTIYFSNFKIIISLPLTPWFKYWDELAGKKSVLRIFFLMRQAKKSSVCFNKFLFWEYPTMITTRITNFIHVSRTQEVFMQFKLAPVFCGAKVGISPDFLLVKKVVNQIVFVDSIVDGVHIVSS